MKIGDNSKHAVRGPMPLTDRAGNFYLIYEQNDRSKGTDDWWTVLERYSPDWVLTAHKDIRPPALYKGGDGAGMTFAGADALVVYFIHIANADDPNRHYQKHVERISGFVLVPYHAGEVQMGAPTSADFSVDNSQPGGSGGTAPMTEGEVKAVAKATVDEFERRMNGPLRERFEDKVKDAIRESGVMTEAMFAGGGGSHVVYQQLINTSYTGAQGALRDAQKQEG